MRLGCVVLQPCTTRVDGCLCVDSSFNMWVLYILTYIHIQTCSEWIDACEAEAHAG